MPSGLPFMKLWIDDYLSKTTSLDMARHGALLLLLIELWQRNGRLCFDKDKIRRICRSHKRTDWPIIQCVIDEFFFIDEEGFLRNERLSEELRKAREKTRINAKNGREGGNAKARNRREDVQQKSSFGAQDKSSYGDTLRSKNLNKNNDGTLANANDSLEIPRAKSPESRYDKLPGGNSSSSSSSDARRPQVPPRAETTGSTTTIPPDGDECGAETLAPSVVLELDELALEQIFDEAQTELIDQMTEAAAPTGPAWTRKTVGQFVDAVRRRQGGEFWTDERLVGLAQHCRTRLGTERIHSPLYLDAASADYIEKLNTASLRQSQQVGDQYGRPLPGSIPFSPSLSHAERRERETVAALIATARRLDGDTS